MARIVDLTLTLRPGMRGVELRPARSIAEHGWNALTLCLYSHAGTHVDAPRHFDDAGAALESLPLEKCVGPARVLDLRPVAPRQLLTPGHLAPWADGIGEGDRLLLLTGWSERADAPEYRSGLPRVSLGLAEWLVARRIALLGVEPPSVADVANREELTAVHRTLLDAGVVIVEGLANLDRLSREVVTFIALPLKVEGGDGSPCRAIAIEE
jgi:kynurenine formamidase